MNAEDKKAIQEIVQQQLANALAPRVTTLHFLGIPSGLQAPEALVEEFGVLLNFQRSAYSIPAAPHEVISVPNEHGSKRQVIVLGADHRVPALWVTIGDLPGGKSKNERQVLMPFQEHGVLVRLYKEAQKDVFLHHIELISSQRDELHQIVKHLGLTNARITEISAQREKVLKDHHNCEKLAKHAFEALYG